MTINQPIKNLLNILKEKSSSKTPTQLYIIELNIMGTVNSLDKQDITLNSDNIIKIYQKKLDSPELPSTSNTIIFSITGKFKQEKKKRLSNNNLRLVIPTPKYQLRQLFLASHR